MKYFVPSLLATIFTFCFVTTTNASAATLDFGVNNVVVSDDGVVSVDVIYNGERDATAMELEFISSTSNFHNILSFEPGPRISFLKDEPREGSVVLSKLVDSIKPGDVVVTLKLKSWYDCKVGTGSFQVNSANSYVLQENSNSYEKEKLTSSKLEYTTKCPILEGESNKPIQNCQFGPRIVSNKNNLKVFRGVLVEVDNQYYTHRLIIDELRRAYLNLRLSESFNCSDNVSMYVSNT